MADDQQTELDRANVQVKAESQFPHDPSFGNNPPQGFPPNAPTEYAVNTTGTVNRASDLRALEAAHADAKSKAHSAQEESLRRVQVAEQLNKESQDKIDAANAAALKAQQDLVKRQSELADADFAKKDAAAKQSEAIALQSTDKAKALRVEADAAYQESTRLHAELRPAHASVRVEGGGWAEVVTPVGPRDRSVTTTSGKMIHHVADHESGDWIYR
jgi:hypothetical protein